VTSSALDALGVKTVYVLGGTAAVSDAVVEAAKGEGGTRTVERVAGTNRYDTASKIATGQDEAGIGEVGTDRTAILVNGLVSADALAAGPIAHAQHLPILLTSAGRLEPEASDAIDALGIEHVVIAGGTAAITSSVASAVAAKGVTVERVAGQNRYETATKLADFALATFDANDTSVDIANGDGFADALAAGPAAGSDGRPLLLVSKSALPSAPATWLADHADTLEGGRLFGGPGAVSDAVKAAAESAASGTVAGAASGQLTFEDAAANRYRMVADGADVGSVISYANTDTFTVDGATATVGGFESAATPGDQVKYTPASGSSPARHDLTNVAATSITTGTVGNVDIANHKLDIINDVNGDAIRKDLTWTGVLWKVDGTEATQAMFEDDLNEGDGLKITGSGSTTTYELTNTDVEGVAADIVAGDNPVIPTTDLTIDGLGDDPADDTNDATYQANGGPTDTDTFTDDGQTATYDDFAADLTTGDVVTYTRKAGVESFALVNRSPALVTGDAVDDLDPQGAPLPPTAEGGHFTVVTEDGPVAVDYVGGGAYVIDGRVASETEFEAAYSPADLIVYRAADEPSGTTQRLELTNKPIAGPVGKDTIHTEDSIADPTSSDQPNSYGVLGRDGETVLVTVQYVGDNASANTYFVNGSATTLAKFEDELNAVKAGTKTATVTVTVTGTGDSAVTQHRLTTAPAPAA
jgi:hypothetical protein